MKKTKQKNQETAADILYTKPSYAEYKGGFDWNVESTPYSYVVGVDMVNKEDVVKHIENPGVDQEVVGVDLKPSFNAENIGAASAYELFIKQRTPQYKPQIVIAVEELEALRANQKPEDWREDTVLINIESLANALVQREKDFAKNVQGETFTDEQVTELYDTIYDLIFNHRYETVQDKSVPE